MDINMPVMDGIESIKELKKLHDSKQIDLSQTKIYASSA